MMLKPLPNLITAASTFILLSIPCMAADKFLPLNPGMWEFTVQMNNSLIGSQNQTMQECLKAEDLNPAKMMEGMPEDACDVTTNVSGDTMTFDMKCDTDGVIMTGGGKSVGRGDNVTSSMSIQGSMGGQNMTMTMESTGRRIGGC